VCADTVVRGILLRVSAHKDEPAVRSDAPVGAVDQAYVGEPFELFYQREYRAVVGLVLALCGNRWVAEDLAQDAFVVAQQRWESVARYDRPGAFVRRAAANLAVSHSRRLAAEARALTRLAFGTRPAVTRLDGADAAFWEAVRRLPRRQAQAIALRYLEDRTVDDIASILGCSPETVRVHLHRGRATLAKRLGVEEGDQ
jgi:RNA polymerase sigma-70 factor (ECF subfamily)